MYISVTIPSIRTVVTPTEGVDTHQDQIDALRVLSAGNTLIMVLLGGILVLQVRETPIIFFYILFCISFRVFSDSNFACFGGILIFDLFFICHAHRAVKNGLGDWN